MPCLWLWQMVKPLCTALGCYVELVEECGNVIPHHTKVVDLVPTCEKDIMLSHYSMYAPHLHLLLDLYHARFSQDLHKGLGLPTASRRHREAQSAVKGLSYLSLSPGMLNRTTYHKCGSLYLPIFLFRYGSFNVMFIPSSTVLQRFCVSLCKIVYTSVMACGVRVFINWRRGFKVLYKPLLKSSCRFNNIFLITPHPFKFTPIYHSTGVFLLLLGLLFLLGL